MIFAEDDHDELVIQRKKTQTRRESGRYQIGKDYAIQKCRTCPARPEGRILILKKKPEMVEVDTPISVEDALAEGGYTPEQYERLYEKMHRGWLDRWAYEFRFIPKEAL